MQTTEMKKNTLHDVVVKGGPLLGIYFSAGYPYLEATGDILEALQDSKVDFVEIGMPYSDPLADGPVIEECHGVALKNGMTIDLMFDQIAKIGASITVPIVLMGYFNPVYKYGIEKFCQQCKKSGIEAVILPDMPIELYRDKYSAVFKEQGVNIIFLATPGTPGERINLIDKFSNPFVYLVSSSSTTGQTSGIGQNQADKLRESISKFSKPVLVGFGISTNHDFNKVTAIAGGAIVGSAFLKAISGINEKNKLNSAIKAFITSLKGKI